MWHFDLENLLLPQHHIQQRRLVRKAANIKVENNGAVVLYVGSSLTVHNPLFFVHKLRLSKSMRRFYCFYWSVFGKFKMIGMLLNTD